MLAGYKQKETKIISMISKKNKQQSSYFCFCSFFFKQLELLFNIQVLQQLISSCLFGFFKEKHRILKEKKKKKIYFSSTNSENPEESAFYV
jgi:hypothetical protein